MTTTRVRYRPRPLREGITFNGKLISCTETSFCMGVDAATLGGMTITEREVRALSTEAHPDPASPGLNLSQLDAVARKLRIDFNNRTGASWAALVEELDNNAAVVAQVWYPDLGGSLVGHALYLHRMAGTNRDKVMGVDPMTGKYRYWLVVDMVKAMRTLAEKAKVDHGLLWGNFRRAPWMHTNQKPA